jgi:hypothetical protein
MMDIIEEEARALANLIAEGIGADGEHGAMIAEGVGWLIESGYLGPSYTWPADDQASIRWRTERLTSQTET